jgi:hypothetical protein
MKYFYLEFAGLIQIFVNFQLIDLHQKIPVDLVVALHCSSLAPLRRLSAHRVSVR